MQLTIPLTTIKLILLTALLWSAVSVFTAVALCSIGYVGELLRPSPPLMDAAYSNASTLALLLGDCLLRNVSNEDLLHPLKVI